MKFFKEQCEIRKTFFMFVVFFGLLERVTCLVIIPSDGVGASNFFTFIGSCRASVRQSTKFLI